MKFLDKCALVGARLKHTSRQIDNLSDVAEAGTIGVFDYSRYAMSGLTVYVAYYGILRPLEATIGAKQRLVRRITDPIAAFCNKARVQV